MATRTPALILPLLVLGCPKKTSDPTDFSRAAWLGDPTEHITYIDHILWAPVLVPEEAEKRIVEEQCRSAELPEGAPDHRLTDIRICTIIGPDGPEYESLSGRHKLGEVYFGFHTLDNPWAYHSPKMRVPERFSMGDSWAASHDPESRHQIRRCEVVGTPWCRDGAAIECLTLAEHAVTWVRNHWCPTVGHMGHDGLVVRKGKTPMWSWSSDVHNGTRAVPEIAASERPFPDPRQLMGIAELLTPHHLRTLSPDDARLW